MFGLSLPAYIGALLFDPIFQKLEHKEEDK